MAEYLPFEFELVTEAPTIYSSKRLYRQAKKEGEENISLEERKSPAASGYLPYESFQDFTERYLVLNGHPFSLKLMPHLRVVYDDLEHKDAVVIQAGRQVAKSSTIANLLLFMASKYRNYNQLFVTPSQMQTAQFSSDRLKPLIQYSPAFKAAMFDQNCIDKVLQKSFRNQSMIHLRYAYLNADRIRGISAAALYVDEIQDLLVDNMPVIEEVLSFKDLYNNPFPKKKVYTGTPKTTSSALHHYWSRSTQNEWLVRCECTGIHIMSPGSALSMSSDGYNNFLDDTVVRPDGFKCKKCGRELQRFNSKMYRNKSGKLTATARWVSMQPEARFSGYRISQLMVKWISANEILEKRESYSTAKYHNEVLGQPYDSGSKPVTRFELMQCTNSESMILEPRLEHMRMPIFLGVDWGTGEQGFTVLTIATVVNGNKFKILGIKKLIGRDADIARQVPIISNFMQKWNAVNLCADWGFGADKNLRLREYFGLEKIIECQYVGAQKQMSKYDDQTYRFVVDRTQIMDTMFHLIRTKEIEIFNWREFEPLSDDILNIDAEYNEATFRTKFVHAPGKPDDVFHSIVYAYMAYRVGTGQPL